MLKNFTAQQLLQFLEHIIKLFVVNLKYSGMRKLIPKHTNTVKKHRTKQTNCFKSSVCFVYQQFRIATASHKTMTESL